MKKARTSTRIIGKNSEPKSIRRGLTDIRSISSESAHWTGEALAVNTRILELEIRGVNEIGLQPCERKQTRDAVEGESTQGTAQDSECCAGHRNVMLCRPQMSLSPAFLPPDPRSGFASVFPRRTPKPVCLGAPRPVARTRAHCFHVKWQ